MNGCRKDVDSIRNEISKRKKEICEIIAIPETSSWTTIMDCLKALRESYLENKDRCNPEDEPSHKFYKEICDVLGLSSTCSPSTIIQEVTMLKENHEELVQNYHDLCEILRRTGY